MEKGKQIYEGKAKVLFETEDPNQIIIHFKDDATAFNGVKKSSIQNKGILNTAITTYIYNYLKKQWIPTHFIKNLSDTDQLCERVEIIPLEVIIRNVVAGSLSKRLQIEEGTKIDRPIFELCYKNDELGDPMINDDHALAMKLCTVEELETIRELTMKINKALIELFDKMNIVLIDFKIVVLTVLNVFTMKDIYEAKDESMMGKSNEEIAAKSVEIVVNKARSKDISL